MKRTENFYQLLSNSISIIPYDCFALIFYFCCSNILPISRNSDFVYSTLNYEFIVSLVSSYVALCKIIISDGMGSVSSDTFFDHHDTLEASFRIDEINQSVLFLWFVINNCTNQNICSFFCTKISFSRSMIFNTRKFFSRCIVSSFSVFQHRASSIGNPTSNILLTVDRERSLSRDQTGSQDLQIFRRAGTFTRKPFSVRGV